MSVWERFGQILFWTSWPLLYIYMQVGSRTRVLIVCGNEILVVKGWLGSGKWSLAGGGLHRGEYPKQGAIREVHEETGIELSAADLIPIGILSIRQSGIPCRYHQFVVTVNDKPSLLLQKLEIIASTWLPIAKLHDEQVGNDVLGAVETWKKEPEPSL